MDCVLYCNINVKSRRQGKIMVSPWYICLVGKGWSMTANLHCQWDTSENRELKNCLYQLGLCGCLWVLFLIARRAKSRVAEYEFVSKLVSSSISLWFLFSISRFLPCFHLMVAEVNLFLPNLLHLECLSQLQNPK